MQTKEGIMGLRNSKTIFTEQHSFPAPFRRNLFRLYREEFLMRR